MPVFLGAIKSKKDLYQDIYFVTDYKNSDAKSLAHDVKYGNESAIKKMGTEMARITPKNAVLIPTPSSTGKSTITKKISKIISKVNGNKVKDILSGNKRQSLYLLKKQGKTLTDKDFGFKVNDNIPKHPFLVDNVLATGTTFKAIKKVIPNAKIVVHSVDLNKFNNV